MPPLHPLTFHLPANLFSLFESEPFEDLKADPANGLIEPICTFRKPSRRPHPLQRLPGNWRHPVDSVVSRFV
jgi:hypothetical protein